MIHYTANRLAGNRTYVVSYVNDCSCDRPGASRTLSDGERTSLECGVVFGVRSSTEGRSSWRVLWLDLQADCEKKTTYSLFGDNHPCFFGRARVCAGVL